MSRLTTTLAGLSDRNDDILIKRDQPQSILSGFWKFIQSDRSRIDVGATESLMACHYRKPFVSFAAKGLVRTFNVNENEWIKTNIVHNDSLYGPIVCMTWSRYSNILIIGTTMGICCWNFGDYLESELQQPWMQFMEHGKVKLVGSVDSSSQGGLLVSTSSEAAQLIVWDYISGTSSSLLCLDGICGRELAWSPSGHHIAASNRNGDIFLIDSCSWQHDKICEMSEQTSIFWLGRHYCAIAVLRSCKLYLIAVDKSIEKARESSTGGMLIPAPIFLDTRIFGEQGFSVGISKITSDSTGSFIAVSVVEIMRDVPADLGGALQPDNVVLLYACQEEYPGMIHTTFLKCISAPSAGGLLASQPSTASLARPTPVAFDFAPQNCQKMPPLSITSQSISLCVLWSDESVTIDSL